MTPYDYTNYVRQEFAEAEHGDLAYFQQRQQVYWDEIRPRAGARVLDVGGGSGQLAALLAEHGCHVTLLEVSPDSIEFARSVCQRVLAEASMGRLFFVLGDLTKEGVRTELFGTNVYDIILLVNVWEHLTPDACQKLIREFSSLLAPLGVLYLTTYPNKIYVQPLRAAAKALLGTRGGYIDQGIHINEQHYWSLRKQLAKCPELEFQITGYFKPHALYRETQIALRDKKAAKVILPLVYGVSSLINILYALFSRTPLRWLLCSGLSAFGTHPRSNEEMRDKP
ncbi:MAG: class I SAM-dependent methyltransferase [Verrucomicrobia bacterium]|nr:class I SAM-dependent methyltransferase [Verrucomicrobiota bacterium]